MDAGETFPIDTYGIGGFGLILEVTRGFGGNACTFRAGLYRHLGTINVNFGFARFVLILYC